MYQCFLLMNFFQLITYYYTGTLIPTLWHNHLGEWNTICVVTFESETKNRFRCETILHGRNVSSKYTVFYSYFHSY